MRKHDPDRYFSALFAPADRRPFLFALYAFNHELAHVGESVREPMIGEIRLQWWRETLDGARAAIRATTMWCAHWRRRLRKVDAAQTTCSMR